MTDPLPANIAAVVQCHCAQPRVRHSDLWVMIAEPLPPLKVMHTSRALVERGQAEWIKDKARKSCNDCSAPFTVRSRRHHCRFCGEIFCSSCSSRQLNVSRLPLEYVEGCNKAHPYVILSVTRLLSTVLPQH